MTPRQRKMTLAVFLVAGAAVATALALKAFQTNLLYFYSPSQIAAGEVPPDSAFRVGGLVETGSVQRDSESLEVSFVLTDTANRVTVVYEGILPDLFREGQGIVANGQLNAEGVFTASQVLAKHDENYMPPEVADALHAVGEQMKAQGQ